MKQLTLKIMAAFMIASLAGCAGDDPSKWSTEKTEKWFEAGEWLNGWDKIPDASINKKAFAVSYYKNPERWNRAFQFLKENDLAKLPLGRNEIDGDNLYASVAEYTTKDEDSVRYEAHIKYIDIQYVVEGFELIGITPMNEVITILEPYDASRDISFVAVKKEKMHSATPDRFFIFFPDDVHKPTVKDRFRTKVRKVVVKVKVD